MWTKILGDLGKLLYSRFSNKEMSFAPPHEKQANYGVKGSFAEIVEESRARSFNGTVCGPSRSEWDLRFEKKRQQNQ